MPVQTVRPETVEGAEELAAIAAAYLLYAPRDDAPAATAQSRWRLAGRLEAADDVRYTQRAGSRWKAAGRLDV
jgi:hypothetical protein